MNISRAVLGVVVGLGLSGGCQEEMPVGNTPELDDEDDTFGSGVDDDDAESDTDGSDSSDPDDDNDPIPGDDGSPTGDPTDSGNDTRPTDSDSDSDVEVVATPKQADTARG